MLNIQSGVTRNSASFGYRNEQNPRVIILKPEDYDYKADWDMPDDKAEFGNTEDVEDAVYEIQPDNNTDQKAEFEEQKAFLNNAKQNVEETFNNVEEMIGNSKAGKPIKAFGKVILGLISVAMGFVSMKWASLGTWKVGESIVKSPMTKKIATDMAKPFKAGYDAVSGAFKKGKVGEKVTDTISGAAEKLNDTKAGQKINEFTNQVKENNLFQKGMTFIKKSYERVSKFFSNIKEKISGLTSEKVKNAVANFFGLSGGVTAGVETVQAEKENA